MRRIMSLFALVTALCWSPRVRAQRFVVDVAAGKVRRVPSTAARWKAAKRARCPVRLTKFGAIGSADYRRLQQLMRRVPSTRDLSWVMRAGKVTILGVAKKNVGGVTDVAWGFDPLGRRLWSRRVVSVYAARLDPLHVLVQGQRELLVIDARDGKRIARAPTRGLALTAICRNVHGAHVIASQGELVRLDIKTARFLWRAPSGTLRATPARVVLAGGRAVWVHARTPRRRRLQLLVTDERSGRQLRVINVSTIRYGYDIARVTLRPAPARGQLRVEAMFGIE